MNVSPVKDKEDLNICTFLNDLNTTRAKQKFE